MISVRVIRSYRDIYTELHGQFYGAKGTDIRSYRRQFYGATGTVLTKATGTVLRNKSDSYTELQGSSTELQGQFYGAT